MEVNIRPLERDDAHTSVNWRNIPEIWEHTGSRPDKEITIDDELAWIDKVIADPTSKRYAILADGTYVGNIYLTDIHDGQGEYHIFIGERAYWGKGIAKLASHALLHTAKHDLGLKTVALEVRHENAAAIHVYNKLGFEETGRDDEYIHMRLDLRKYKGKPDA